MTDLSITKVLQHQARPVRAPRGSLISCANWEIEAAYRMIQNNLDPEVAENPDELVVYGGIGKAARNWECFEASNPMKHCSFNPANRLAFSKPTPVLLAFCWLIPT